jgi:hypothetical protein
MPTQTPPPRRFVPTLTQVVATVAPPEAADPVAVLPQALLGRVMQQLEDGLERKLRVDVSRLLQEQLDAFAPKLWLELSAAVREAVQQAVQQAVTQALKEGETPLAGTQGPVLPGSASRVP